MKATESTQLRKEIAKVICDTAESAFYSAVGLDGYDAEFLSDSTDYYEEADRILALLKSERNRTIEEFKGMLPKTKHDTSAEDLRAGTFVRGQDSIIKGYNQALNEVRKVINDLRG